MEEKKRRRLNIDIDVLAKFLESVRSYTEELIFGVQPDKGLYHYTDLSGLQGIISTNDLWLTNSLYSNDDEEMTHGYRIARDVIEEERINPVYMARPHWGDYLNAVREFLAEPVSDGVYICCFCLSGNLLSQWRGYGGNGSGVSIEFEPHGFASVTGPDSPCLGLMRLWKVIYDQDKQRDIIRNALIFGFTQNALLKDQARNAADAITFFIPTFKNQDFEEEDECRLIFTPPPFMNINPVFTAPPGIPTSPRFRVARGMLIPYFSMRDLTNNKFRLPIKRIVVGPTPNKELNVSSTERMLAAYHYYDVPVESSSTPYRA